LAHDADYTLNPSDHPVPLETPRGAISLIRVLRDGRRHVFQRR
jgi:hypothetical protein